MTAQRFRKKPVVIEAMQFTDFESGERITSWSEGYARLAGNVLLCATLEGEMLASLDDWIIRGLVGEFYPCKPDIFEQTYEPAE